MIDVSNYSKCISALQLAFQKSKEVADDTIEFEIYRSACVKEFELIVEQTAKLLKKFLYPYFSSNKTVDNLAYKDTFRLALTHNIISENDIEIWLQCRDIRNQTAHEYGSILADEVLEILPKFIEVCNSLIVKFNQINATTTQA